MYSKDAPKIILVCAFHQEALPLIKAYRLKRRHDVTAFEMYSSKDISLIQSGMGQTNAANAVGYCAGLYHGAQLGWLNVGCAGHRTLAIGMGMLVHKISQDNASTVFYPDLSLGVPAKSAPLVSRSAFISEYPETGLCDMEAAGFFSAALHHSCLELIHSYKVVSDNLSQPASKLVKEKAEALITGRMENIDNIIEHLSIRVDQFRRAYHIPEEYEEILQLAHFTTYQQEQLQRLLQRWHSANDYPLYTNLHAQKFHKATHVIQTITKLLDESIS